MTDGGPRVGESAPVPPGAAREPAWPGAPAGGAGDLPERVVLIGAPGSGKSAVGALLAGRWGRRHHDVDTLIEEQLGTTIAEVFATRGEEWFRRLEVETTAATLRRDGVVSLGGGAPMSAATQQALAGEVVVWLQVSVPVAASRVGLNVARPLLLGNVRGRLMKLLEQRTPVYRSLATHTVDTDDLDPEQVAGRVAAAVEGR